MDFFSAVKICVVRKYATFSGRAPRSEYWYFILFDILASIIATIIDVAIAGGEGGVSPFSAILLIALLLPGFAVTIRRLHDLDRSGWWWLVGLVPVIGTILLLVWYCRRGTPGDNRFGPDPLAPM